MKGWIAALFMGVVGTLVYEYQSERVKVLRDELAAVKAATDDMARRHELERQRAAVDDDLRKGGDEGLSDYMSGASGKLWP